LNCDQLTKIILIFQAGYAGGYTKNPTYQETCTGATGHAEVVRVIFDPEQVEYSALLKNFWENHNPIAIGGEGRSRGSAYLRLTLMFSFCF